MNKVTTTIKHRSSADSAEMIASFLNAHPQGALTTITAEGKLQGSVVNLFETDDSQYSFMTKKGTRKFDNLTNNPNIVFISYDPFSRTEAEIEGTALHITDQDEINNILEKIRSDEKLGRWHKSPFVNESDDFALFTIYPTKLHMSSYWERENNMEVFHEFVELDTEIDS